MVMVIIVTNALPSSNNNKTKKWIMSLPLFKINSTAIHPYRPLIVVICSSAWLCQALITIIINAWLARKKKQRFLGRHVRT